MSIELSPTAAGELIPPGDGCLRVIDGDLDLFIVDDDGRRRPFISLVKGGTVITPTAAAPYRLVAVPRNEGRYRINSGLPPIELVCESAYALTQVIRQGAWPVRVVPQHNWGSTLVPGEAVLNDTDDILWVRVSRGTGYLAGSKSAIVDHQRGVIPLPPGVWIEAGIRCRIELVAPDSTAGAGLTELALRVVRDRWFRHDQARLLDMQTQGTREGWAISDSVTTLVSAVAPDEATEATPIEIRPALALAQAYGYRVDADQLRTIVAEVAHGVMPVDAVARACSLTVRRLTLNDDWANDESEPFLCQVRSGAQQDSITTLVRWRNRRWLAEDPLTGASVSLDLITQQRPAAVEYTPRLPSSKQRLSNLLPLVRRGSRPEFIWLLLTSGVTALIAFWTPRLLGQVAELLLQGATSAAIIALFLLLATITAAGIAWSVVQTLTITRLKARSTARTAVAVWDRLVRQRAPWHSQQDLGTRMNQGLAINMSSWTMSDQSIRSFLGLSAIIGSLAAILTVGWKVLGIVLMLLGIQLAISLVLVKRSARLLEESIHARGQATGRLTEMLRAIPRLRVAGAETRAFLRWSHVQADYIIATRRTQLAMAIEGVIRSIWPSVVLLGLVIVIGFGAGSFADFVIAQTAATAATLTISTAVAALSSAVFAQRTLKQLIPVLEGSPENDGEGIDPGVLKGGFVLSGVSFAYPNGPDVVHEISLSIEPGEHIAIVGPSGCGKTTLVRLLLGLEEPTGGVISVDGQELASVDRTALRSQMGCVLQSSQLLPGTIRDNVAMNRPLTTAQIWQALAAAALEEDVRGMPMGLDTPVTDGNGTLSGGQAQRVLIARALADNPRVIVFDEATSALDNTTQSEVVASLDALRITRIVVAHRLSTIRRANRIIVFDNGRIVDSGTYNDLANRPGIFFDLIKRQMVE